MGQQQKTGGLIACEGCGSGEGQADRKSRKCASFSLLLFRQQLVKEKRDNDAFSTWKCISFYPYFLCCQVRPMLRVSLL